MAKRYGGRPRLNHEGNSCDNKHGRRVATNPLGLLCRHCNRVRANRPRGLCWGCYYKPGVRDLYPTHAKYGPRGGDHNGPSDEPEPTDTEPLTEARILVMMARAAAGQSLKHSDDLDPCAAPPGHRPSPARGPLKVCLSRKKLQE